jgi:predicted kinase
MRKWVSERLKRRKKKPEEQSTEPSQAPLQPAYFESEPAPQSPTAQDVPEPEPAREPVEAVRTQDSTARPMNSRPANANQRGRGRRRRGGRSTRGRGATRVASAVEGATQTADPVVAGAEGEVSKIAPVAARPPKGTVVLAIGLPGSGKSSWFKRHSITPLSSDTLRALLFDDPTEQRFQDLIFSNLRSMLKARLIAHRPLNYVDTTNLTPHDRHSWIKLAKDFGFEIQAVFFDVPLEVCLERNQKRERVVPEEIMRRFAEKLKPPTFEEGFSKITVVRVKQKEATAS